MDRKNLLLPKQRRAVPEPAASAEAIEMFVKQGVVVNELPEQSVEQPTNQPIFPPSSPSALAVEQPASPTHLPPRTTSPALKERWVVTAYKLRESTQETVNRLSRITGKSKGEIVDEALRDYLAKVRQQGPLVLEL